MMDKFKAALNDILSADVPQYLEFCKEVHQQIKRGTPVNSLTAADVAIGFYEAIQKRLSEGPEK